MAHGTSTEPNIDFNLKWNGRKAHSVLSQTLKRDIRGIYNDLDTVLENIDIGGKPNETLKQQAQTLVPLRHPHRFRREKVEALVLLVYEAYLC
jgi:hypothetical protein